MVTAEHWYDDIEKGDVVQSGPISELTAPVQAPLGDLVGLDLAGITEGALPANISDLVARRATTAGSQGS